MKKTYRTLTILSSLLLLAWSSCSKIVIRDYDLEPIIADWPIYGGNTQRTNTTPLHLRLPLTLAWEYKASAAIGPSILVARSVLFFGTMDGRIYAIDAHTGVKIGLKKMEYESTCAYHNNHLVIARRYGDNTLYYYNLENGNLEWKIDAGDIASEPLVTDDAIYIAALYNHVDRYRISDGTKLWTFNTEGQLHSSPSLMNHLLVVGCDNGFIYTLNSGTGKLIWKYETGGSVFATPVIHKDRVFVGSSDGSLYALKKASGTLLWSYKTNGRIRHACAVTDQWVIVGSSDGKIYGLDPKTGALRWNYKAESVISTSPLIAGEQVYFGSLDHHYYAISLNTGQLLWKYETRGRVRTSPVIWDNYLFGASEDNYLYAFKVVESEK